MQRWHFIVYQMPPKVWDQKKYLMAETLYEINIVDEEQEAKDDKEWLPLVIYQKIPWWADIDTQK